jgi:hypothetical protein
MTIAILDDNLLWSTRLKRTVEALGHRAVVASPTTEVLPEADVAIVALSPGDPRLEEVLRLLRERGTHLIGHAGHKRARHSRFAGSRTLPPDPDQLPGRLQARGRACPGRYTSFTPAILMKS